MSFRLPRGRLTIRARLTLSYAGLATGSGAVLIAVVYVFLRYVPSYRVIDIAPALHPRDSHLTEPSDSIGVTSEASDFLNNFLVASFLALAVLALLGAVVGWVIAGRIIRPLAAINVAATRAATGALDHRVALGGPRDEIRDLSETFDRMLSSLERSFAAHRRFAANASHELRTPLATTQTMIDVALDDPDAATGELRALAERVREVNRASIQTVDALLDLADAETGSVARERVDLAEIARDAVHELGEEAADAGIELAGPVGLATVDGDQVLLRHAVSNLVRNAVRHNRPGGRAGIRLSMSDEGARVTVTNDGPYVSRDAVDTLVEPFTRGAGRALTRGSGHGLGLAIVVAVASAHDGALTLDPNPDGGLTAHLDLPRGLAPSSQRRISTSVRVASTRQTPAPT
jgi:two-component system, OmpR family, sensor histidine kinase VanS